MIYNFNFIILITKTASKTDTLNYVQLVKPVHPCPISIEYLRNNMNVSIGIED